MNNIAKGGFREDLNCYFRSRWEANTARYWNLLKIKWQYEPKEFEFKGIKRGNRFYKPDFYLPETDKYVEVKGWFTPDDKTKIRRFKKYYPEEFAKLHFVIGDPFSNSKANCKILEFLIDELKVSFLKLWSYRIRKKSAYLISNWE